MHNYVDLLEIILALRMSNQQNHFHFDEGKNT